MRCVSIQRICIFNDFAIAATKATNEYEQRVAIFDCDAHHGDGTEMLLKKNKKVMTYSVHEYGIFPGSGLLSDYSARAYNFPLAGGTGDGRFVIGYRDVS
jgi:acetoin utilization deacetylase AcuC-like enzyme